MLINAGCSPCGEEVLSIAKAPSEKVRRQFIVSKRECGATTGPVLVGYFASDGVVGISKDVVFEKECYDLRKLTWQSERKIEVSMRNCKSRGVSTMSSNEVEVAVNAE